MKKFLIILFILSITSFIIMTVNFLALNDISHDYVSKKVLINERIINNVEKIPEWTTCRNEWKIVQIDFIIRVILMTGFTLGIIKIIKNSNNKKQQNNA